jgi:hypothetical protein
MIGESQAVKTQCFGPLRKANEIVYVDARAGRGQM